MINSEVKLLESERIEDLQFEGLKIVQDRDLYSFTSDSVILANFLKIKKGECAVEIGSGSGVISILATKKTNAKKIICFELQEKLAKMSKKSLKINKIEDKITVINDKIQNFKNYIQPGSIDVVFSNPPYKREGSAKKNENESKALARHEKTLPLSEFVKCAAGLLKFGGRLYVVYDADRSCELISTLISFNLQPKRMFFTENGRGKVVLVVIEAVLGGKPGVQVLPNLITNDKNGLYLEKLKTYNL